MADLQLNSDFNDFDDFGQISSTKDDMFKKKDVEVLNPLLVKDTGSSKTSMSQCPYCQRVFNVNTTKEHMLKCQRIKNKPKPPPCKDDIEVN